MENMANIMAFITFSASLPSTLNEKSAKLRSNARVGDVAFQNESNFYSGVLESWMTISELKVGFISYHPTQKQIKVS